MLLLRYQVAKLSEHPSKNFQARAGDSVWSAYRIVLNVWCLYHIVSV